MPRVTDTWRLLALPPLDPALLAALFDGLPVQVDVPPERTLEAVRAMLPEADVVHWSRSQHDDCGGARYMELDELFTHSQLLVVVIALAPATRGLISAGRLAQMPPGSYVVNAARGGVLDETALLQAISSGHLA